MKITVQNISGDTLRDYEAIVATSAKAISQLGGRLAALYKFTEAALPQLSATQRKDVLVRFRQGVEDAMSVTDDIALPAEYHAALLEQTNVLLIALETEDTAQRYALPVQVSR